MRTILCVLLLALASCDTLLQVQMHLENQRRDLTANLKAVPLDKSLSRTVNKNVKCEDHPMCSKLNCKMLNKQKQERYVQHHQFGFWDKKPSLRNDKNGWNCVNIVKFVFEWGCKDNKYWRYQWKTVSYKERDPKCDAPIDETYELSSVNALEMELDDADHQCKKVVQETSELISCKNITLEAEWTMTKAEGAQNQKVNFRSQYQVDLDFAIDDKASNKTLVKYMVDQESEKLRLVSSVQVDEDVSCKLGDAEMNKIQKHVNGMVGAVAFKQVLSAEPVHNEKEEAQEDAPAK